MAWTTWKAKKSQINRAINARLKGKKVSDEVRERQYLFETRGMESVHSLMWIAGRRANGNKSGMAK